MEDYSRKSALMKASKGPEKSECSSHKECPYCGGEMNHDKMEKKDNMKGPELAVQIASKKSIDPETVAEIAEMIRQKLKRQA